jgi:hypothetical protein
MVIILDTNILHGRWHLKGDEARLFLNYVRKMHATILFPKIAWLEIEKNYREDFIKYKSTYASAVKNIGNFLPDETSFHKIEQNADGETAAYMTWLSKTTGHSPKHSSPINSLYPDNIIPFTDNTLERVVDRAVNIKKPFAKENQREFKDTLVWEAVLDVVRHKAKLTNTQIVFISNDRAFSIDGNKSALHEELRTEADLLTSSEPDSPSKSLLFYKSLQQFLSDNNEPIAGITAESIAKYLNSTEGASSLFPEALQPQEQIISYAATQMFGIGTGTSTDISHSELLKLIPDDSFYIDPVPKDGTYMVFSGGTGQASFELTTPTTFRGSELRTSRETVDLTFHFTMNYKDEKFSNLKTHVRLNRVLKYHY